MLFDQLVESVTGERFNVKITKGPFLLIDEYPEVEGWGAEEEHFAYNFTINGHKGVLGEDHDGFRYLISGLSDSFVVVNWRTKKLASLVGKAIEAYELKQPLNKSTQNAFNELIDEL